jgi:putative ABC transport system permease protein
MRASLMFALAWTELRAGVRGFRVFLACLAIGVAAIAAAGSTAQAFRAGLAERSRELLGGDLALDLRQRAPPPDLVAWMTARGGVSISTRARAMAEGRAARRLVDVRGVDARYPLVGAVVLQGSGSLSAALADRDGVPGAVAAKALFDALGAKIGDEITVGLGKVRLAAVMESEPDELGQGFNLAPRMIIDRVRMSSLGLGEFGSLFESQMRVRLADGVDIRKELAAMKAAFPDFAARMRDRTNAQPGLQAMLDGLQTFLSFVGLAALLAGGLGVRGAVTAYVESRRGQIATLKTLGASTGEIYFLFAIQVGALALLGVIIGLAVGAAAPAIVAGVYGDALPLKLAVRLYPAPLFQAASLGVIAAAAFAAAPLGQARVTPPAALHRGSLALAPTPKRDQAIGIALLILLAVLATAMSPNPRMAAALAIGAAAAFLLMQALGYAAQRLARLARPRAKGVLALALAGLGGPGSLAPAAAPALGLGVALLAALAQVQANLVTQVTETAPKRFASAVYLEIPPSRGPEFDALVSAAARRAPDKSWYQRAEVITVRLAAINGQPIDMARVKRSERWLVDGDTGATIQAQEPAGSRVAEGRWWPANYAGAPLVSLEEKAARGVGIKAGDAIRFDVLGQRMDARVANLRAVDWSSFGANFAVIFAPGALENAHPRSFAFVRVDPLSETRMADALGKSFPTVQIIPVRDALALAAKVFDDLKAAIRAVAAVAIAAGALAIAGALAASARQRVYEGAILKAMGASRAAIIAAFGLEQAFAGFAAALIGAGLGFVAAYFIVTNVIEAMWSPDWALLASVIAGAALALGAAGAAAGWLALTTPAARVLRAEG